MAQERCCFKAVDKAINAIGSNKMALVLGWSETAVKDGRLNPGT